MVKGLFLLFWFVLAVLLAVMNLSRTFGAEPPRPVVVLESVTIMPNGSVLPGFHALRYVPACEPLGFGWSSGFLVDNSRAFMSTRPRDAMDNRSRPFLPETIWFR